MAALLTGRKAVAMVTLSVVLLVLSACGGKAPSAVAPPTISPADFTLVLTDGGGVPLVEQGAVSLDVENRGGIWRATARLNDDDAARGADFFALLSYPAGLHPTAFITGAAYDGDGRAVSLAMLDRSPIPIGISLIGAQRAGGIAAGELFTVEFAPGNAVPAKSASRAPTGGYNVLHAADIAIQRSDLTVTFEWREKNRGDYDRDGRVAIDDVTPIAVNFGKRIQDNPDVVDLVDGNSDGVVNISDVTPIAINFGGAIEGYRIWRSDLASGLFLPNLLDAEHPEVSATRPDYETAPPGRLYYAYTDTAPNDTVYYVFYPYGDGEVGVASDAIHPFTAAPDTTPPSWVVQTGIISAQLEAGPQIRFTFGQAVDEESPPVRYVLYWQEGAGPMDFGTANAKIYPVADGEVIPYTRILLAADGVQADTMYSLCVRARDNSGIETTNTNYLTVGGGSPDDVTPPEWTDQVGIISAVPGDGQVTVTWGEATDAASPPVSYLLWYAEESTGIEWADAPDLTFPAGTLSATILDLQNGVSYEFGVRARDSSVNLNTTGNTNTLTATPTGLPESPYPFGNPPSGVISGWECTDSALACDVEAQPVIVSANSKDVTGLNLHYYDDGGAEWLDFVIEDSHKFYHPQIVLSGEEIYVAAFDGDAGQLKLYTGNAGGDSWSSETVVSGYAQAFSVDLDIHEPAGVIGIVASLNTEGETGANDELRYFFRPLAGGTWENELIDSSQLDCFATFMYHPATGEPLVGLGRGELDFTGGVSNALLCWAERLGEDAWKVTQLPGNRKIEGIDISVNPADGHVFLALCQVVKVTVENPPEPPQDYNGYEAAVGEYDGVEWRFELAETATWYPEGEEMIHLEFEGADPQVSFRNDGRGRFCWVHIDMVGSDMWDTVIYSNLETSSFDVSGHTWSVGVEWTEPYTGASADSMVYVAGGAQASYARIPDLNYFTLPRFRNDYVKGDLAYHRE